MCTGNEGRSRWGCIHAGSTSNVATEITDSKKNLLFPDSKNFPRDSSYRFTVRGYDGLTADAITFLSMGHPHRIYVEKGTELHIWYAEDLRDWAEGNNSKK